MSDECDNNNEHFNNEYDHEEGVAYAIFLQFLKEFMDQVILKEMLKDSLMPQSFDNTFLFDDNFPFVDSPITTNDNPSTTAYVRGDKINITTWN